MAQPWAHKHDLGLLIAAGSEAIAACDAGKPQEHVIKHVRCSLADNPLEYVT